MSKLMYITMWLVARFGRSKDNDQTIPLLTNKVVLDHEPILTQVGVVRKKGFFGRKLFQCSEYIVNGESYVTYQKVTRKGKLVAKAEVVKDCWSNVTGNLLSGAL